ncbi:SRPBCC family protein [Svornostia abyssi]|uniref:SRPBCC family protein n=1 Tax=Svornostia abyssi TaxID=2898438 RepID=A0ABY5PKP0_9ACTN|nr:SRPBCC family protein [Parviterribacteraceae bacterium J379]
MLTYEAESPAPAEQVWPLLARPNRWHEWAPHVRGASGLGDDEVQPGRKGAAKLMGVVPVPVEVTSKTDGRSWTWKVGPISMVHRVRPRADGTSVVGVDLHAPAPLEPGAGGDVRTGRGPAGPPPGPHGAEARLTAYGCPWKVTALPFAFVHFTSSAPPDALPLHV